MKDHQVLISAKSVPR